MAFLSAAGVRPRTVKPATVAKRPAPRIGQLALIHARAAGKSSRHPLVPMIAHPVFAADDIFKPLAPPAWMKDRGVPPMPGMAADEAFFPDIGPGGNFPEGIGFFGYQYLAELSQRPEFRKMTETLAMDMTREWIRFTYTGEDGDKQDRIRKIEAAFHKLRVKDAFHKVAEQDGFFGRGHLFIDLGERTGTKVESVLVIDPRTVKKGSLKRLQVVEPTWTYPGYYNSTDPLDPHYYRPETWYVMATKVHATRLLTFTLRPVPDILKAAYAFGGLSMSQMAKPYVDNWLQNRQSVADLLRAFTVFALKVDMGTALQGEGAESLNDRIDLFTQFRDNLGLMVLNKGDGGTDKGEELTNVSAPLQGLNDLLSSSQEQMAAVAGIPLVKLLGVTPSGLNASSDGEVRVYYDSVAAAQERLFRSPLETVLKIVQLSEFGDIDEDIDFEFLPLWQMDETEQAAARKSDADVDTGYVNAGVLSPEEVREKLAADKTSPWANLDTSDVPEPPEQPDGMFGEEGEEGTAGAGAGEKDAPPKQAKDGLPGVRTLKFGDLDIVIETDKGQVRRGKGDRGRRWTSPPMAAPYGYIADTWSTEGRGEEMDCFIGPNRGSDQVFVVDQLDLGTGVFDEHKVMLGYDDEMSAVEDYCACYDCAGRDRIMAVSKCSMGSFKRWLKTGDLYKPFDKKARDGFIIGERYATDGGEFKETDHPRANNGQFGSGGGGKTSSTSMSGGRSEAPDKVEATRLAKAGLREFSDMSDHDKRRSAEGHARRDSVKDIKEHARKLSEAVLNRAGENVPADLKKALEKINEAASSSSTGFFKVLHEAVASVKEGGGSSPGGSGEGSSGGDPYFSSTEVDHLPHAKQVRNPANSWEGVEKLAGPGREEFKSLLDKVAGRLNLSSDLSRPDDLTPTLEKDGKSYLFVAPNKSYARAAEKVVDDYGGDWSMLKDAVRATIAVQSVDDIRKVVDQLKEAGLKLASKPKDNINNVKPEGYRDLNLLVELPNGLPAELQINVKSMVVAKVEAHRYYEEASELERKNGNTTPDASWTSGDREKYQELMTKQRAVYDPAWESAGGSL